MRISESVAPISQISEKVKEELRGYAKSLHVNELQFGDSAPESATRRLDMLALYPKKELGEKLVPAGTVRGEFENKEGEPQPFEVYVAEETKKNKLINVYFIEMMPGQDETSLAGDVTVEISPQEGTQKKMAKIFWTHTMKSNVGTGVGTHGIIAAGEYMLKQHKLSLEAGNIVGRSGITTVWEHLVQAGLAERNPYRYVGLLREVKKSDGRKK